MSIASSNREPCHLTYQSPSLESITVVFYVVVISELRVPRITYLMTTHAQARSNDLLLHRWW
jgi:hypothetical protein